MGFLRPMHKYIEDNYDLSKPLKGVEIGVRRGEYTIYILEGLPIERLYLIDPYKIYDGIDEPRNFGYWDKENNLKIMTEDILDKYPNTTLIRKKAEDAVNDIPNNLDFIYIDGNHHYEYIKKDIELYYPKVRKGGIFGGHDYRRDVEKAVKEFFKGKHKIYTGVDVPYLRSKKAKSADWWVVT